MTVFETSSFSEEGWQKQREQNKMWLVVLILNAFSCKERRRVCPLQGGSFIPLIVWIYHALWFVCLTLGIVFIFSYFYLCKMVTRHVC